MPPKLLDRFVKWQNAQTPLRVVLLAPDASVMADNIMFVFPMEGNMINLSGNMTEMGFRVDEEDEIELTDNSVSVVHQNGCSTTLTEVPSV